MTAYEMAKEYYPRLWPKARIDALHRAGKLTDEEYYGIIGTEDTAGEEAGT